MVCCKMVYPPSDKTGGVMPQTSDVMPQTGDVMPQLGGVMPQLGDIMPQTDGVIQQNVPIGDSVKASVFSNQSFILGNYWLRNV